MAIFYLWQGDLFGHKAIPDPKEVLRGSYQSVLIAGVSIRQENNYKPCKTYH